MQDIGTSIYIHCLVLNTEATVTTSSSETTSQLQINQIHLMGRYYNTYEQASLNLEQTLNQFVQEYHLTTNSKLYPGISLDNEAKDMEDIYYDKTLVSGYAFKRKKNQLVIYKKEIATGLIYNTVTVRKFGQIGILNYTFSNVTTTDALNKETTSIDCVEKLQHGRHVRFIDELQAKIKQRSDKKVDVEACIPERSHDFTNVFRQDLEAQLDKLRPLK